MANFTVITTAATPTTTGVEGALDVGFDLYFGEQLVASGEVTLAKDHNDDWSAYGDSPDTWVSGEALRVIREYCDRDGAPELRDVLREIEAAAAEDCGDWAPPQHPDATAAVMAARGSADAGGGDAIADTDALYD